MRGVVNVAVPQSLDIRLEGDREKRLQGNGILYLTDFPRHPYIYLSLRRISNVLMYFDGAGVGGMDEEQGSRHWNKCVDRTNHLRETTRILAFESRELYSFEGMGYCPGEGQPAVAESAQAWVLRTCIMVQDLPRAQLQNAGYTRKVLCLSFKQFHLYPLIL